MCCSCCCEKQRRLGGRDCSGCCCCAACNQERGGLVNGPASAVADNSNTRPFHDRGSPCCGLRERDRERELLSCGGCWLLATCEDARIRFRVSGERELYTFTFFGSVRFGSLSHSNFGRPVSRPPPAAPPRVEPLLQQAVAYHTLLSAPLSLPR